MATSLPPAARLREQRASGLLDGGAPLYDLYETADGEHMSVGALEPQFWTALVERIGVGPARPRRPGRPRRDPRVPSPPASRRRRRPSGPRSSTARTRASRPSYPSPRRRATRTSPPAAPSSSSTASPSRRRPRASRAPPPRSARRPPCPASTPATRSPPGASPTSTRSSPAASRPRPRAQTHEALPLPRHPRARTTSPSRSTTPCCAGCGLRPDELVRRPPRARAARRGRPGRLVRRSSSAAGPFNVCDPEDAKSAAQRSAEADLRDLADQVVAADFPFLGACYGIGVLGGRAERRRRPDLRRADRRAAGAPDRRRARRTRSSVRMPSEFHAYLGHKEAVAPAARGRGPAGLHRHLPGPRLPPRPQRLRHPVPPRARPVAHLRPDRRLQRPRLLRAPRAPSDLKARPARAMVTEPAPGCWRRFVERYA